MFKRILVANRGEIALRIIRACREMGIETVAIFSEADRGAQYLELANEAYCVGSAKSVDSYLKIDRVISAAEIGNVQAIHPGYGFLSENAHFNEVCRSCNIDFIGPTHEAMRRLGDKNEARKLAREANVPTVPGSQGLINDEREAVKVAHEIGFPVLRDLADKIVDRQFTARKLLRPPLNFIVLHRAIVIEAVSPCQGSQRARPT